MKGRGSHRLLFFSVAREYLESFLVAFTFFFFIFFINQILLVAQKILVRNVSVRDVIALCALAIPQFLLYTFPFSSLTASAMVLGDLSAGNEALALRSSGISMRFVFYTICLLSLCVSALTLFTADRLLPETSRQYKDRYVEMMRDLPTIELSSYGANTIGSRVMVNARAEGKEVENMVLFSDGSGDEEEVISSRRAAITMEDPLHFIYRLDLETPEVLRTKESDDSSWSLASARDATMFLDFSTLVPSVTDTLPSQLSIGDLRLKSDEKKVEMVAERRRKDEKDREISNTIATLALGEGDAKTYNELMESAKEEALGEPIDFYYQYYRAEMEKKLALSMACFMLVFLTFPLSYRKLKHGRLIGFGVAMFSAVAYWYLLFFAQLNIFKTSFHPFFLIWMPNIVLFLLGVVLTTRFGRQGQ